MKSPSKIKFRCWYCNRRYDVAGNRAGERLACNCERRIRVPRRSGGSSRCRSLLDWFLEISLYSGGGAVLGLGLAVLILSRIWWYGNRHFLLPILACFTLTGLCLGLFLGLFFGERGLEWIGAMIRGYEDD